MDQPSSIPAPDSGFPLVPPPPVTAARNEIFYGPNGLRAGWRILVFILLLAATVGVIHFSVRLVSHVMHHGQAGVRPLTLTDLSPGPIASGELSSFLLILFAAWIMSRIERRSIGGYGIPLRNPFPKTFWTGLFWGFFAISCVLGLIAAFHGFHIVGIDTNGSALAIAVVEWSLAFLAVGLSEEYAFRGYMLFTLTTGIGFWVSAILMSTLFALAHVSNSGETPLGLTQVAVFGMVACIALGRTGNLWWPIGFHAAWDWGQTFFYGVPDSGLKATHNFLHSEFSGPAWLTGGSTGPEASIFSLVILVIAGAVLIWRYPEVRYPDPASLGPEPARRAVASVPLL
jgi:membrane protease YdiL (CAAX protease family)